MATEIKPPPGFRRVVLARCPKCGFGSYADGAAEFCATCRAALEGEGTQPPTEP
jgi:hypothetical protein